MSRRGAPKTWSFERQNALRQMSSADSKPHVILHVLNKLRGPTITLVMLEARLKLLANAPSVNEDDLIANFLKTNGVTKCPTAICCETTATLTMSDRLEIAAHQSALDAAMAEKWRGPRKK